MTRRIASVLLASALVPLLLVACSKSGTTSGQGADTSPAVGAIDPGGAAAAEPPGSAPADEGAASAPAAEDAATAPDGAAAAGPEPAAASKAPACKSVPAHLPLAQRCKKAGAKVHTFPNTCAGLCSAVEKGMFCGQALTDGCKCPPGQCIDDDSGCCRRLRR